MASISLNNIVKKYFDTVTAVKDFNLEIEDREFIVLVGPSGCGKSTMLRMIAGLESITEGEISIGGQVVNQVPSKDRNIAMVFQNYALYPHMNVYQNMAFGLKMRKISKKCMQDKIMETAAHLQISDLLKRKPSELSGGQKQRVALGRAMVREPEVFLLDEPLSNLDAKLRTEMRIGITKLHRELQTTFVYVTHDQTEAMTMADRIVIMKDGLIQQAASPEEVYQYPTNLFVAEFIGVPKINVFQARLQRWGDQFLICMCGGEWPIPPNRFADEILDDYGDCDVLAGIRPHDIDIVLPGADKEPQEVVTASVELEEMLGAETYVHLKGGAEEIIVSAPGQHRTDTGTQVSLRFHLDRLHLFDRDTEQSLRRVAQGRKRNVRY